MLITLDEEFGNRSSSLAENKLLTPSRRIMQLVNNRLLHEELDYNIRELQDAHIQLLSSLNYEQLEIYQVIKQSVDNNQGCMFFVYGHGGTSKTYMWNTIISGIHSMRKIILAIASFDIASLLLPGGRIGHSRFKISSDVTNCSTYEIKKGT